MACIANTRSCSIYRILVGYGYMHNLCINCIQLTEVGTQVHKIITSDPDIGDAASVEFTLVSTGDSVTVS